jgi:radical SAM protein with 4Fe4S-binding SPASM domain
VAELPVQQATKYELVINLETAKGARPRLSTHDARDRRRDVNEPRWKAAREASINLCEKCRQCKSMNACGGGYLPHRFSKENGYDNPSVYCDDLYATYEHIRSVLGKHIYVSKPGGERLNVSEELARAAG